MSKIASVASDNQPMELPPSDVGGAPRKKKSRGRTALLTVLLLLVACSIYLWSSYLFTRKPLTNLPIAAVMAEVIKPRYLFSIHDINAPLGVAVSPQGDRIYVTESGGQRLIRAFDRDGKELAQFTPPNKTPLDAPVSAALDSEGRLFVADAFRHAITIFDAGGNFKKSVTFSGDQDWIPIGIHIDGKTLLVAGYDTANHGVRGLNLDGQTLFRFGRDGEGDEGGIFASAGKAVTDSRGRIYVTDSMKARVAVFDQDRKFLYNIAGFAMATGLGIDQDDRLYVVDTTDQNVKVYDVSSTDKPKHLFDFGRHGIGDGEFNFPNDIAIDDLGRLYITDRASNRVQVWTY
ncbi:MAG TPA: hypothetical protein VF898_09335 [Chloroflexota bacterium]